MESKLATLKQGTQTEGERWKVRFQAPGDGDAGEPVVGRKRSMVMDPATGGLLPMTMETKLGGKRSRCRRKPRESWVQVYIVKGMTEGRRKDAKVYIGQRHLLKELKFQRRNRKSRLRR